MTGRHRYRSKIRTAVVWIIRTAAFVFAVIAVLLIYMETNS